MPCGKSERRSVPIQVARPRKRIVQFLDWHFIDRDLLAQVDRRIDWEAFLLEVEATQLDQAAALEFLAHHHGLKTVVMERLTETDMPLLPDKLVQLREAQDHQPALKAQLAEAKKVLQAHPERVERHAKAQALYGQIADMLTGHREDMLKMGAPVGLLMAGKLGAVLPLDNAKTLDAAGPVLPGGQRNPAAVATRDQAMARKALAAAQPVAVILCGGAHDLTAAIRAVDGAAEYYRVTVRGFAEAVRSR